MVNPLEILIVFLNIIHLVKYYFNHIDHNTDLYNNMCNFGKYYFYHNKGMVHILRRRNDRSCLNPNRWVLLMKSNKYRQLPQK